MRKLIILFILIPFLSKGQINLKTQSRWLGGTGKSILMTNGTAIDTLKAIEAGYVLTWDGTDFVFSASSGGSGITSLNSLTGSSQTFSVANAGSDFAISSFGTVHSFRMPSSSASNRGLLTPTDWSTFNSKQDALSGSGIVKSASGTISYITDNSSNWDNAYTNRISSLTVTGSSGSATLSSNTLNIPTYTLSGLGGKASNDSINSITGYTTLYQNSRKLSYTDTTGMLQNYADSATLVNMFKPLWGENYSDQTTTSTSLVDITNLRIPIGTSDSIYFTALIHVGCSSTNGARYAVTIPAGASMKIFLSGTSSTTVAYAGSQILTVSGSEGSTTNAIANTAMTVRIEGKVKSGGTSGYIQIQGRSINAGNTVTWYATSIATGHKIY